MKYNKYTIINKINMLWEGKIIVAEDLESYEYKGVHSHILVRCLKCGNEYSKRINDLLHGYGCNKCANLKRRTNEEYKEIVYTSTNGEYTLLSNHDRTRDIATFRHNCENSHEFDMKIHNFITLHQRCPYCKKESLGNRYSNGILKIQKFLNENSINFKEEFKFKDCRNSFTGQLLPFDIYIESLNVIIEFDGIQHYKSVKYFGGEKRFKQTKINDKIKNDFCKENNIHLIRIPYTEESNIEKILEEEFNQLV